MLAHSDFVSIEKNILFAAAKKSAVSDVERCFDEARELVRETCFIIVSKQFSLYRKFELILLEGVILFSLRNFF